MVLMTVLLLLVLDETLARRGGEKPEPGEPLLHPLLLLASPGEEDETGMHLEGGGGGQGVKGRWREGEVEGRGGGRMGEAGEGAIR